MDTIKKLLIVLSAVMLINLNFNQEAYAGELHEQLNIADEQDTEDVDGEDDINLENFALSDSETEEIESEEIETEEIEEIEDANIENLDLDNLDLEDNNIEDIDLDKYEIVFDEQGQAYLIEKKPIETEEVTEDVEEKLEEKAEEKTKDKKKKPTYSEKDLRLLASLVYAEAGNQSYNGMLAVANVVLNRAKSNAYYHVDTVYEVIYDRKWAVQFSVTVVNKKTGKSIMDRALELYDTGKINCSNPEAERKAMKKAIKAAKAALEGENNIGDYLCFRMNNKGASSIKKRYKYIIIEDHIFYRTK